MAPDSRELLSTSRFQVIEQQRTLADGSLHKRQTVVHPGAVTILPMVEDDVVCLIKNYRISVDETLIELPAGTLEPPEAPELCASRELIEETGYRAETIQKIHQFYMSPGILNERMVVFLATGLTLGDSALEAGEEIERLEVTWDEAMAMVDDGRIHDAKTLVGLLFYDRLRKSE